MQKFDVLDPNLDLYKSRFLEASAGTGKTFAIENLVVRLVEEGKTPLNLNEILAVTFTREAAKEMKGRIRAKLQNSTEEEIQVFTIHGFCYQMLTEFAFESNTPFTLQNPDQSDPLFAMRRVVEDFFRTGQSDYAEDVERLLKKMRYDLDQVITRVVDAMQKNQTPKPLSFPSLPKKNFEELWGELQSLSPSYKRMQFEKVKHQVEKIAEFLQNQDPTPLFDEKTWFFEKLKEEKGIFHTLQTQLLPPLKIARDSTEALRRIAEECRARWECKAKKKQHFSFGDLLEKMQSAIQIPSFCEKVRAKYKVVIVDEFQDTDPLQWEIFESLFLGTHILYLVGDPKQSIYRFRSADIYTYMRAANALGEENKAYLDTNFRSSPKLIEALNQLFTKNPKWLDLPSLPGVLSYHPVHAGRKESKLDEPPITYFGMQKQIGRERSLPTKEMEEEKLFPYIASEILRLKELFSFSDFAVLIKDRFQALRLQLFFNRYRIPSAIKRTLHLAESRGFRAMEMFLQALSHPEKDPLVRAVLKGPLMEEKGNPFFTLQTLFKEKGFANMLAHFLKHDFCGDSSLYLEFQQTAELLMQVHQADLFELLHLMQKWKQITPEMDPSLALRSVDGSDQVAIMTPFASKGLEFEVVFVPGLASASSLKEADAEQEAEEMRQLYVAFTRAREKLVIPRLIETTQKLPLSPIERFFKNTEVPIQWIEKVALEKYRPPKQKSIPKPKEEVKFDFPVESLVSFSSLVKPHASTLRFEAFQQQDFSKKNLHTLPLGTETGIVIHSLFESYFQNRFTAIEQIVCESLIGTHLEGWEEVLVEMVTQILRKPLIEDFSLSQLKEGEFFPEMEFLYPQDKQWIKGFADLVFKRGDVFYLLDWKTNWLGSSDADYTEERVHKAMEEHEYYLQAKIYGEALQRYVKRLYIQPKFGGAFYVFLRGKKEIHCGNC